MEAEQSIASHVAHCLEGFRNLSQILDSQGDRGDLQTSVVDSIGRFRVWCGNIGAHKFDKSSLDYRLRDSRRSRSTVIGFLQDLHTLLVDCKVPS